MTQCERLLDYLESHPNGITQYEAIPSLGILRLASRVSDLRKDGVKILSERVSVNNRWNEKCYVSRYKLIKE